MPSIRIKRHQLLTACACSIAIFLMLFWWILDKGGIQESVSQRFHYETDRERSAQWRVIRGFKKRRGVALVVHGLNLKPERMEAIIRCLNHFGIDALNLSLRGHGDNFLPRENIPEAEARLESFRTVDYKLWLQEVRRGYDRAKARAQQKSVPLYFIGYSLGGLLGCDLLLSSPETSFEGMILFAPALNVKAESYLLKAMMPFPNLVIDSLSPPRYRANRGTPMAAYKALFEAVNHFENNINRQLNRPTLLFIDEKDEIHIL